MLNIPSYKSAMLVFALAMSSCMAMPQMSIDDMILSSAMTVTLVADLTSQGVAADTIPINKAERISASLLRASYFIQVAKRARASNDDNAAILALSEALQFIRNARELEDAEWEL